MTYIYSGIFSNNKATKPYPKDSEKMVFRNLNLENYNFGALFPQQAEEQIDCPNNQTIKLIEQTRELGFIDGIWVYYMCWGGELESVALAKIANCLIVEKSYQLHDSVSYEDLHHLFLTVGIETEDNGNFHPFVRNFWGEHGY